MRETKYAWIYLNKAQNMHKLHLSNNWIIAWNWLKMSTVLNIPEEAMYYEYALIYMYMSNCA